MSPDCATAWTTLGDHLYRSFWVNPEQAGIGLNSRTHHAFQKAENLIPGHPRATFLWSMMLTDTGNQSLALKLLEGAIRLRPGMPDLLLGHRLRRADLRPAGRSPQGPDPAQ